MYDRHLDVFLLVAERGSFAKAAEELYLSSHAVIKQINLLERELGVVLLRRTNRGVSLTPAGSFVYEQGRALVDESRRIMREARRIAGTERRMVRLSTSQMRPSARVWEMWERVESRHPRIGLEIVQVPDDARIWRKLVCAGDYTHFDVLLTIKPDSQYSDLINEHSLVRDVYTSLQVCAVPKGHRLRGKRVISLDDLDGESVWLVKRGSTSTADAFRDCVLKDHPRIQIMDYDPYDIAALNHIGQGTSVAIISAEWSHVHPTLECIELEGDWTDTVCLVCRRDAGPLVREFVDAVADEACGAARVVS